MATLSLQFFKTCTTNDESKLQSPVGAASGAAVITFSAPFACPRGTSQPAVLSVPAESRAQSRCCLFGRAEQPSSSRLESPEATRLPGTSSSKRPRLLQCNLGGFSRFPAHTQPPRLLGTRRQAQRHPARAGPGETPEDSGAECEPGPPPALPDAAATSPAGPPLPAAPHPTGKRAPPASDSSPRSRESRLPLGKCGP